MLAETHRSKPVKTQLPDGSWFFGFIVIDEDGEFITKTKNKKVLVMCCDPLTGNLRYLPLGELGYAPPKDLSN